MYFTNDQNGYLILSMRDDNGSLNENSEDNLNFRDRSSKVDLNNLMKKLKEEEKLTKRNNLVISAAAVSAVAVFGIIMTL